MRNVLNKYVDERPPVSEYLKTLNQKEIDGLKLYIAKLNPFIFGFGDAKEKVTSVMEFIRIIVNVFHGMKLTDIDAYVYDFITHYKAVQNLTLEEIDESLDIGEKVWKELNEGENMSTRSMILKETEPGKYKGCYCHSDGYLTYNGAMLIDHYSTRERVDKLISLGDMSILQERIEPDKYSEHNFEHRQDGVTVFYGRDRGEKNTEPKEVELKHIDDPQSWIVYCYIYGLDNKWRYFECGSLEKTGLLDLQEGLDNEYKALGFSRPADTYGFFTKEEIKEYRRKEKEKEKNAQM